MLQSAPSAVQVLLVLLLPESPRWLMSRGKDEKALELLAKYHANGDRDDPMVRFEYAEMKASIVQGEQKGRWSDLIKTREFFTAQNVQKRISLTALFSTSRQPLPCVYLLRLRCLLSVLRHQFDSILPAQHPAGSRYQQRELPEYAQRIHPHG